MTEAVPSAAGAAVASTSSSSVTRPRSSVGQSSCLLSRRSHVRVVPGAPDIVAVHRPYQPLVP
jgi:hypothetical protein